MIHLIFGQRRTIARSRFGNKAFAILFACSLVLVVIAIQPAVRADDQSSAPTKNWFKSGLSWLYFNCGNTYDNIVRHEKAVRSYDEALRLVPDSIEAIDCRGYSLVKIGKVEEALKDLNQAVAMNPTYSKAYLHRSEAYSQAKQFDLALKDIETADKLGCELQDIKHAREFMDIKQKERR